MTARTDAERKPLTDAERQARRRARLAKQGLREVRGVLAYPEDEAEIKRFAEALRARRRSRLAV